VTKIMAAFKSLVRFTAGTQTHYGDLVSAAGNKYTVRKLEGSPFTSLRATEEIVIVEKVGHVLLIYMSVQTNGHISSLNARLRVHLLWCASD
jgi:chorismate synthase